jgi:hypothetical protein
MTNYRIHAKFEMIDKVLSKARALFFKTKKITPPLWIGIGQISEKREGGLIFEARAVQEVSDFAPITLKG